MCSIPSVKGVELGAAVLAAQSPGSEVHDEPRWDAEQGFHHLTNRQGGLAGGVTDGEPVWALVHFKPISTLLHPLRSVDIGTGAEINAHYERSDICVVPAGCRRRRGDAGLGARRSRDGQVRRRQPRRTAPSRGRPPARRQTACDDRPSAYRVRRPAWIRKEHDRAARRRTAWLGLDRPGRWRSRRPRAGRLPRSSPRDGEAQFRDLELTALERDAPPSRTAGDRLRWRLDHAISRAPAPPRCAPWCGSTPPTRSSSGASAMARTAQCSVAPPKTGIPRLRSSRTRALQDVAPPHRRGRSAGDGCRPRGRRAGRRGASQPRGARVPHRGPRREPIDDVIAHMPGARRGWR